MVSSLNSMSVPSLLPFIILLLPCLFPPSLFPFCDTCFCTFVLSFFSILAVLFFFYAPSLLHIFPSFFFPSYCLLSFYEFAEFRPTQGRRRCNQHSNWADWTVSDIPWTCTAAGWSSFCLFACLFVCMYVCFSVFLLNCLRTSSNKLTSSEVIT